MAGISLAVSVTGDVACRDRWLEPFSSSSIWNTAIGAEAHFEPANLFSRAGYNNPFPSSFHNDQDFIVRTLQDDPYTDWYNQGDWDNEDHCKAQTKPGGGKPCSDKSTLCDGCVSRIRLPHSWTSASDCDGEAKPDGSNCRSKPNQKNNNAMAILLPDNVTLLQLQPAYRCGFDTPLFARWGNATDGAPQRFPNVTSIMGEGLFGAHGGSGLSSIGGSIRLGELLPHTGPIKHALKIEINNFWYYGLKRLNPSTAFNGGRTQYVWPATGSNSGCCNGKYNGSNPYVAPGALLALTASDADEVNTTTVIGTKIKDAMRDYGAYLVDGAGPVGNGPPDGSNRAAICMDALVNAEMREHFGYAMTYPDGVSAANPPDKGGALYLDLLLIFRRLSAVINNGPQSIGGGGKPRVPTKPPICEYTGH
jgi:hypothetical protein